MKITRELPLRFLFTGLETRVILVCSSWAGTPYIHDACSKGRGVDCIHYGAAVLDELYGTEHSKNLRSLPPDACVHNRAGVQAAMRALLRAYSFERIDDGTIEAGDLLILGPKGLEASHLMIVASPGQLWHASVDGVVCTGFGISADEQLVGVFRAPDKDKWR